jgi:glucokinase
MNTQVIGIDIGGSHATAAVVNTSSCALDNLTKRRIHVDANAHASEIIEAWSSLITEIVTFEDLKHPQIGIAMPGPFDYDAGVSLITGLHKFESLYRQNVKALLASQLSIDLINFKMMNDAAAFLRGEVYGGAARGYDLRNRNWYRSTSQWNYGRC